MVKNPEVLKCINFIAGNFVKVVFPEVRDSYILRQIVGGRHVKERRKKVYG